MKTCEQNDVTFFHFFEKSVAIFLIRIRKNSLSCYVISSPITKKKQSFLRNNLFSLNVREQKKITNTQRKIIKIKNKKTINEMIYTIHPKKI